MNASQVVRGGRRVDISIYDIVVGDVVPLNIGDQVLAFIMSLLRYHLFNALFD